MKNNKSCREINKLLLKQIFELLYRIFILLGLVGLFTFLAPDTVYGAMGGTSSVASGSSGFFSFLNPSAVLCNSVFKISASNSRFADMSLHDVVELVHRENEESALAILSAYPSSLYIPLIQKNVQVTPKTLRHILFGDFHVERTVQPYENRAGELQTDSTNAIVLKGGMHSYKGIQAFEELREQTGTPIDFSIINEESYSHKGRKARSVTYGREGVSTSVLPMFHLYRIPESRSLVVGFPKQAVSYDSYQKHFQNGSLHRQTKNLTPYEVKLSEFIEHPWLGSIYDRFQRSYVKILFPEEMNPEIITQLLFKTLQSTVTEWIQESTVFIGTLSVVWKGQQKLTVKVILDESGRVKSFFPVEDLTQSYRVLHEESYVDFYHRPARLMMKDDRFELMMTALFWMNIYHHRILDLHGAVERQKSETFVRQRLVWLSDFFRDSLQEYELTKTQGNPLYSKVFRVELDKIAKQVMKDHPRGILPVKYIQSVSLAFAKKMGVVSKLTMEEVDSRLLRMMQEEQGKIKDIP